MMMNEFGLIPPSVLVSNPELGVIASLLTALADPAAAAARLAELAAEIDKHNAVVADFKSSIEKLRTDTEAAREQISNDRAEADAEIQRKRTQLDIDAAAVKQRADATDTRSDELDKLAQTLAAREAELNRRQSAFREHADAISNLKA
jgi:chromosome segregation ATPase